MTTDGFTIERTFDAPRDLVWKALTEPAQFAVWFGGDHAEVPVDSVSMDVRPGGTWAAHMIAGGAEMDWKGEYVEVDEPAASSSPSPTSPTTRRATRSPSRSPRTTARPT